MSIVDINDYDVYSVYWVDSWNQLFIGTPTSLNMLTYERDIFIKAQYDWIGGVIYTTPLDFAYDEVYDALWLAETNSVHKFTKSKGGMWWRYGQRQGSPNAQITSVDNKVTGVINGSSKSGSTVLVATENGLSVIESSPWTLSDKAKAMKSFQEPRHNRHGLTTSVTLTKYGDVNSFQQECDDNDGLWTSMHAM
jgi:hypothetical protein